MGGARVEVLCVGTELLSGKVNTHTAALAGALQGVGLRVAREGAVSDSLEEIARAAREALERSDLLIVCGGLGPTFDDLTREAVSRALEVPLLYRPALFARIRRRFLRAHRRVPAENRRQAFVLRGARALPNPLGSAPGQLLPWRGKTVLLLPGPPDELRPMFAAALPELRRRHAPRVAVARTELHLAGIPESEADERLRPLLRRPAPGVEYTILARIGQVDFRATATAASPRAARRLAARAERAARRRVGAFVFGADSDSLESVVGALLRGRGLTLAVAESCTAGLLSSRLTAVPGSSDYFLGGAVAYADAAKRSLLGVRPETLRRSGAVSAPCARKMAQGARGRLGADLGVSITGIAGPGGGSRDKPVGLVFLALARRGRPTRVERRLFSGNREQVRERSVMAALTLLWRALRRS